MRALTAHLFEFAEGVMNWIIQANIVWFKRLLETEPDPSKRAMLVGLLAEQEAELKEAEFNEADETVVKEAY